MIQKLKTILISSFALAFLAAPVATVGVASAAEPNIQDNLCSGAADLQFGTNANCQGTGKNAENSVNKLVTNIINIFSVVVGIVAVIMIIIGGFRYIVSGGDSGNVTNAKNTILYAIIGLVIVAFAQFVVKFILGKITGAAN